MQRQCSENDDMPGRPLLLLVMLAALVFGCEQKGPSADTPPPTPVSAADAEVTPNAAGKIDLRILCTTSPNEGRTDDFVAFLSEHFVKVATTDYRSFREEQAEGFDVVILDYGTTRPGSPVPELSRAYSRATITMGVAGSEICRRLGYKPGYL